MQSDYLNEDLICGFFADEPPQEDNEPRRDEVSLNLTVTSRDSKSHLHGTDEKQYMDPNYLINLALSGADKLNSLSVASTHGQQLIERDLDELLPHFENNKPLQLTMPNFTAFARLISSKRPQPIKIQDENQTSNTKCLSCANKEELIQIIKQEHEAKVAQCFFEHDERQKLQRQIQRMQWQQISKDLVAGVEQNLLREYNEQLKEQLNQLRGEIERERMEKSAILQKSNTLLRTKDLLEKRLETAHQKSFSNAKNSTNPTNLNDSINRVDSMICFGETEPNIEELLRFYNEEIDAFRDKIKRMLSEERKINRRLSEEAKNKFLSELPEYKVLDVYKNIAFFLAELKKSKQLFPEAFSGLRSKKFQSFDATSSPQDLQELRKTIAMLERDILGLETENKNLSETKDDLVAQIEYLSDKIRKMNNSVSESEENYRALESSNKALESSNKALQSEVQKYQIEYKSAMHRYRTELKQRKKLTFQLQDLKGAIRVYCRVRPKIGQEIKQKSAISSINEDKLIKDGREFEFDHIFNEHSTQHDVFAETKGLIQYAYEGKNLCIFAYGQTGSGKTYTIHGNKENPGLAHHISGELFGMVERDRRVMDTKITMSIVEIYKENVRDLLYSDKKIEIKEDQVKGVYLEESSCIHVLNHEQFMDLYESGIRQRSTAQTDMNGESSRSHCILIISIEQTVKKGRNEERRVDRSSKITLIDLAGAEKLTSSNPLIAKETQFINKSLSSLVDVFSALKDKKEHIPYRNSKLTYLLKDSLTNKSNILTFINISPAEANTAETTNSLNFGLKARAVERSGYIARSKPKEPKEGEHKRTASFISHG